MLSLSAQTRKNHYIALSFLLVCLLGIVLVLIHFRELKFEKKIEIAGLATVAGFVIIVFQLWEGSVLGRAKFLTEYLTLIYTDEDLNSAFHALVETYSDDVFDKIDETVQRIRVMQPDRLKNTPVFDVFTDFQGQRAEGKRYYHPECFQGSEEERRLDALIGYLDLVGYHYYYGLIRMRDIAALLNYHLATLASRKVVAKYLRVSGHDWWEQTSISSGSGGGQLPYLYFRHMLGEYVAYNEKNQADIRKMQSEIASKIKDRYL